MQCSIQSCISGLYAERPQQERGQVRAVVIIGLRCRWRLVAAAWTRIVKPRDRSRRRCLRAGRVRFFAGRNRLLAWRGIA
jgi:hypothetical protein